jgi:hypothetical protein
MLRSEECARANQPNVKEQANTTLMDATTEFVEDLGITMDQPKSSTARNNTS